MKAARYEDLPLTRVCNSCGVEKGRDEMIIHHRPEGGYYFRPKCKNCHNERERGHRREYKRRYLQRWRKNNRDLEESYWKNDRAREQAAQRARNFTQEQREAIAIQRRMNKRGQDITISEARELLAHFGRCYPMKDGLTKAGLRRCEEIRSRLRHRSVKSGRRVQSSFEIRLMVYDESLEEKSLVIPPDKQPIPYQKAAENLRQWHRNQRILAEEAVDLVMRRANDEQLTKAMEA